MYKQDISNVSEFTHGVARFRRIAANPANGAEAWRREYHLEPWRNRIELFTPQAGKYYPELDHITRRIPASDPKADEKVAYYLEHGLKDFYPGDKPVGIFEEEGNQ